MCASYRSSKRYFVSMGQLRCSSYGAGAGVVVSAFLAFAVTPPGLAPLTRANDAGMADLYNQSTRTLPYDDINWSSFVDLATWSSLFGGAEFDAGAAGTATADPLGLNTALNSAMSEANNWFANGWIGAQFDDWVDFSLINPLGEAWPFRSPA